MNWLKTEAGCQIFWISNKFETLGERFVYENYHFVASIVNSVCKKQSKSSYQKKKKKETIKIEFPKIKLCGPNSK